MEGGVGGGEGTVDYEVGVTNIDHIKVLKDRNEDEKGVGSCEDK